VNNSKIVELEASLSASQQQIQSLQNFLNNRSIEIDEVRKQNQRLQSSGDLQATLGESQYNLLEAKYEHRLFPGRVSEEVLALRLDGENYKFKIEEANSALNAVKSKSDEQERNLKETSKQKTRMAVEIHTREKYAYRKFGICIVDN
jgi:chromosome segregation ATPase